MMKTWLWRSVVAVACCVGITGCTISNWVTDSRNEVIPEASATTIRPIIEIDRLSQERPSLLVKLSKQLEGPLELQEHKREEVQTIWGRPLETVGYAWGLLVTSPMVLVVQTLFGTPGEGLSIVGGSFLAAMGFNAPEGNLFHIPSISTGQSKIDKTPMGNSTRTAPWSQGPIEVKADGQAPTRLYANENGYVAVELKEFPIKLSQRSNDLMLSISAPGGTVAAAESVTVPVPTLVAWEQKEAVRAKLEEEENKAQAERTRLAQEAREQAAQARAAEEKRLASIKTAALAAVPPAQSTAKAPSGSGSEANAGSINPDASSARVCDTQCGMIVAESRCNQVQDNQANLSCKAKNGMMLPDTPELCAAAKALSGCVTQAEKEAAKASSESGEGNGSGSSSSSGGAGGSTSCVPDEGLLRSYVEAHEQWKREGKITFFTTLTIEAARKSWYERLDQEMMHSVESLEQGIARKIRELEENHWENHSDPSRRKIGLGTRSDVQRWGCAVTVLKARKAEEEARKAKAREARESEEEMDCKVEFDALTARKTKYEQLLDKGEVVRLSELAMWYLNKGTALIDRICPQSASYLKQRASIQQSYKELQRVCDAHASSPPCVPRLPGGKPAPAPQAAAPLPPLQNKADSSSGARGSDPCPGGGNLVNGRCRVGVAQ